MQAHKPYANPDTYCVPVQGRFTRPVAAGHLCMGQEFVKPGNAPPWLGELVFTAAAKVFSSSTQVRQTWCRGNGCSASDTRNTAVQCGWG